MFIGSLVLLFSGVLITFSTSLPVINKIIGMFSPAYEGKVIQDVVGHHNKYQLWTGVFIAFLSSFPLFLRYGAVNWEANKKRILLRWVLSAGVSVAFTFICSLWLTYYSWQFGLLTFAGIFTIITNLDYLFNKAKGRLKLAWASIAHVGFGMMIVGTVASGLNQKSISTNPFVFSKIFSEEDVKKYVQLIKGKTLFSEGYLITYVSDTLIEEARERKYTIQFEKLNDSMQVVEKFSLHPNAVYANDFSKVAAFNPDTKHYLHKDIFTCVVGLPPALQSNENAKAIEDSLKFTSYTLPFNDTVFINPFILSLESVTYEPNHPEFLRHSHDAGLGVRIRIDDTSQDTTYYLEPALGIEGALLYNYPATAESAGIKIKLAESALEDFFVPEDSLQYSEFTIKNGGNFNFGKYRVVLKGFNRSPEHPNYQPEEKDIAIGAILELQSENGTEELAPLYVIRDNMPMSIKAYSPTEKIHLRFSNILPDTEEFTFKIAQEKRSEEEVVVDISTDVPRTDYLILQATIFPGINLFWLGCILMMLALLLAGWDRYKKKHVA
jgi:cytochrome c-type biogenesis protein CcmF